MARPFLPLTPERFLARCEPLGECLVWTGGQAGSRGGARYAVFSVGGRTRLGHRVMHELTHGPIPPGYEVDHTCSVPLCLRPEHLEAVTPAENKRRVHARGRTGRPARDTCSKGHPFDTTRTSHGRTIRACTVCRRASRRQPPPAAPTMTP